MRSGSLFEANLDRSGLLYRSSLLPPFPDDRSRSCRLPTTLSFSLFSPPLGAHPMRDAAPALCQRSPAALQPKSRPARGFEPWRSPRDPSCPLPEVSFLPYPCSHASIIIKFPNHKIASCSTLSIDPKRSARFKTRVSTPRIEALV